jgi:SAM-dependent methyltransferase
MEGEEASRASYDALAEAYADRFVDELAVKPLDRALLSAFVEEIRNRDAVAGATVADVGCGPGHIARFLHGLGVDACGVDLSPRMCEIARRLNPGLIFYEASMLNLPVADAKWAGIVAFYAVCHIASHDLAAVFAEFRRVLKPDGLLLVSFHGGDEVRHADEMLGVKVDLAFHFHSAALVTAQLRQVGFDVRAVLEREPYEPLEVATRRVYVQATRSAAGDPGT